METAKNSFQQYDPNERERILHLLFEDIFHIAKIDFLANKEVDWTDADQLKLEDHLSRLNNFEPVQYIIGKTFFYDSYFRVTPATLIPRPETEELVDLIISDMSDNGLTSSHIMDIGTGTGCIAISLAKKIHGSRVTAVDISREALAVAKENAMQNQVSVSFVEMDFLKEYPLIKASFDVIVSNPPYVLQSEKKDMRENVLAHEPHLALFVDDDNALVYYDALLKFASTRLHEDGTFYAEINEQKGNELIKLAHAHGFASSTIIKDIYQKDRIIKARRK